jgi:Kef-type K+ transport system membrane component KefB
MKIAEQKGCWGATLGLTLTLFLIGAGLSIDTLRSVGWRPVVQGVVRWIFISIASLLVIMHFKGWV